MIRNYEDANRRYGDTKVWQEAEKDLKNNFTGEIIGAIDRDQKEIDERFDGDVKAWADFHLGLSYEDFDGEIVGGYDDAVASGSLKVLDSGLILFAH